MASRLQARHLRDVTVSDREKLPKLSPEEEKVRTEICVPAVCLRCICDALAIPLLQKCGDPTVLSGLMISGKYRIEFFVAVALRNSKCHRDVAFSLTAWARRFNALDTVFVLGRRSATVLAISVANLLCGESNSKSRVGWSVQSHRLRNSGGSLREGMAMKKAVSVLVMVLTLCAMGIVVTPKIGRAHV